MLKLTTDKHEASRGLSATAEFLVLHAAGVSDVSMTSLRISDILRLRQLSPAKRLAQHHVMGEPN